jgi:hypothetical protein
MGACENMTAGPRTSMLSRPKNVSVLVEQRPSAHVRAQKKGPRRAPLLANGEYYFLAACSTKPMSSAPYSLASASLEKFTVHSVPRV